MPRGRVWSRPGPTAGSRECPRDSARTERNLQVHSNVEPGAHSRRVVLCAFDAERRWNVMQKRKKFVEIEEDNGSVLRYFHHENGDGLVEKTAAVDPTAYVDKSAYVDPRARVEAGVRVGSGAWIDQDAVVHERAEVGTGAHIGPEAVVGRGAKVGARTKIGARSRIWDRVRLESDVLIPDDAVVRRDTHNTRAA